MQVGSNLLVLIDIFFTFKKLANKNFVYQFEYTVTKRLSCFSVFRKSKIRPSRLQNR